jgi:hypothetical protein
VCEKRVLRRIFGPMREEVVGGWRKPDYEKVRNFHASPNAITVIKSRRMRRAGHAARMGEMKCECKIFIGKPVGKRPLGRPRHIWEDNIRMDIKKTEWEIVD